MREVLINKPNVSWDDIGGLEDAKEKLRELVELPLIRPDLFEKAGIKPAKGILLFGPPGTGKTLLAKAVATEANANFISVKGPELISKWVGESEKHVREIFKKARQVAPAIIFFDEFDSISKMRGMSISDSTEKVVNQLLTELDGIEELEKVIVIAATNRKDLIDPSLLRPGRIEAMVELPIPDKKTREKIFEVHTRKMPLDKAVKISDYIEKTDGWTGAEIASIARNAGINAIKRFYKTRKSEILTITKDDFDKALIEVAKSTGKQIKEEKLDSGKEKEGKNVDKKEKGKK
jgi:transitional endoplasmic reticulum ATPase